MYRSKLQEKLNEALRAVLPVMGIVLALSFTVVPMPAGMLTVFLAGSVLLVVGMMFFTLGAELAMEPMGERLGVRLTRSKKLWVILPLSFLLGVMITVSEPDLQVLARQVPAVPNTLIILAVAVGVGLFLLLAILRMLFRLSLRGMLIVLYTLVFALAFFVPESFLAVAFDSGGVTTGPMTVPFIMAFGIGISSIRSDENAWEDSFGLVALCSVGPILAVLLLGLIYRPEGADYVPAIIPEVDHTITLGRTFLVALPEYMGEVAVALLPIAVFFFLFQLVSLKLDKRTLRRIGVGTLYTYFGLSIFLTGVNLGFMPVGSYLGEMLASLRWRYIIIPLGMLIGYYIVMAEPAVYVLMKQVEELTDGAISGTAMRTSLSIGVAVSVGLAMLRVLTGMSIFWLLIPGYALAIGMSFFCPRIFTAIAFDSGGVASGPMTATFLLPFAVGACVAVGGDIITDAFGVVAMVAMTPLITIQGLGLLYRLRARRKAQDVQLPVAVLDGYGDYDIIEL